MLVSTEKSSHKQDFARENFWGAWEHQLSTGFHSKKMFLTKNKLMHPYYGMFLDYFLHQKFFWTIFMIKNEIVIEL